MHRYLLLIILSTTIASPAHAMHKNHSNTMKRTKGTHKQREQLISMPAASLQNQSQSDNAAIGQQNSSKFSKLVAAPVHEKHIRNDKLHDIERTFWSTVIVGIACVGIGLRKQWES